MSAPVPVEGPRAAADLSALRVPRDPEAGRRRLWPWALAALGLAALAALSFRLARGLVAARVETTTAAVVTEGQAMTVLTASGYVEAETRADISPKITSRITDLRVTEGSRVKKGDLLARLDHTDLDAQLAEALASWESARRDLTRQEALFKERLAPQSVLDAATALEASTRARVGYIRALLDYTVLRAPFDGVVVAKRAHVGEAVSPFGSPGQGSTNGGAIVTLVDFSTLYVGADVNESNLARIGDRQPAEITLDAYPDHVYHGALRQVVPSADRQKGTVKVKVAFLDPDEKILPDLSARVSFTSLPTAGRAARTRVEVPESAVAERDGASGVFLVRDGRARFRAVTVGARNGGRATIESGLAGGETLVAEAARLGLRDGDRVRVRP